jgi:hypothetical protein
MAIGFAASAAGTQWNLIFSVPDLPETGNANASRWNAGSPGTGSSAGVNEVDPALVPTADFASNL